MCWSLEVSVAFAVLEAVSLAGLLKRSLTSDSTIAKAQKFILPLLVTVLLVETIEALQWMRPDDLVAIRQAGESTCSQRNRWLTMALMPVLCFQPFLGIFACRRSGVPENNAALMVPEMLAFITGIFFLWSLAMGEWGVGLKLLGIDCGQTQLADIADSFYLGMHHTESCTYIGEHGHLHWTFKVSAFYFAPGGYAYALINCAVAAARPWYLFSGPITAYLVLLVVFLLGFGWSFEAGSVWCWSALGLHAFFWVQPALFDRWEPKVSRDKWAPLLNIEPILV